MIAGLERLYDPRQPWCAKHTQLEQDSYTRDPAFVYNGCFEGSMEMPAVERLYEIVREAAIGKPRFALAETGTCDGLSACFLAKAVADAESARGHVWTGEMVLTRSTGQERPWPWLWVELGLFPRVTACVGDTRDPRTWTDREHTARPLPPEIDFLFIDSDHTRETVCAEWLLLGPRLRAGGTVAFHDTRLFPQVADAADWVAEQVEGEIVEHRSSRGLSTVPVVRPLLPPAPVAEVA